MKSLRKLFSNRRRSKSSQVMQKQGGPTQAQIQLVQETWQQVVPISEDAAGLFYGRLFELDPELRPLFKTDMKAQGAKLMKMIGVAVKGLDKLETIVPAVQDLGKRHVGYGVKPEHYDTVGTALLWTLEQGLGDGFKSDVREAWAEVYGLLAKTMIDAAETGS